MPKLLKDTFKARLNKMPPGQTLTVTGKIEVPTAGWKASLVRREPQGINPRILLLDVKAVAPAGKAAQVIEKLDVSYEERPPQGDYTQVTVFSDNESITIDVEIVQ